jgi:hypothetical protein
MIESHNPICSPNRISPNNIKKKKKNIFNICIKTFNQVELKIKYGSTKKVLSKLPNNPINQNVNSKWTTSFLLPFTKTHNILAFKIQNFATCKKMQIYNCYSYFFKETLWKLYLLNLLLENGDVQLPRHKL